MLLNTTEAFNFQLYREIPELTFTCSKLTIETLKKDVKYVQSQR